jgi:hypothetical protein
MSPSVPIDIGSVPQRGIDIHGNAFRRDEDGMSQEVESATLHRGRSTIGRKARHDAQLI